MLLLNLALNLLMTAAKSQVQAEQDSALSTIKNAEHVIISAYQSVVDAEAKGGNIDELTSKLNEAGSFLTGARAAYAKGNFTEASSLANQARYIGEQVDAEGSELKAFASSQNLSRQLLVSAGSILAIVIIIFGSILIWLFLKKRHFEGHP